MPARRRNDSGIRRTQRIAQHAVTQNEVHVGDAEGAQVAARLFMQTAQALGHDIRHYKLTVFVVAAMYAGFGGSLLGMLQGFMPPDAFMFATSGEIVMQTAIGGAGWAFLAAALLYRPARAAADSVTVPTQ